MMRILIADDEQMWRTELRGLLRIYFPSAEFVEVATGPELKTALRGSPFNLITKDCRLLGTSGKNIVGALREQGITTPIIVISGVDTAVMEGIEAGANAGCTKDRITSEIPRILRDLAFIT